MWERWVFLLLEKEEILYREGRWGAGGNAGKLCDAPREGKAEQGMEGLSLVGGDGGCPGLTVASGCACRHRTALVGLWGQAESHW